MLEETHHYWHGEKVSFGVMMLMLEERPQEEVANIGLKGVGREKLEKVAEATSAEGKKIHNGPFEVDPQILIKNH